MRYARFSETPHNSELCSIVVCPISILQWASIALVGVLIDSSVVQLLAFCGIHVVMFAILVCFKPFANR